MYEVFTRNLVDRMPRLVLHAILYGTAHCQNALPKPVQQQLEYEARQGFPRVVDENCQTCSGSSVRQRFDACQFKLSEAYRHPLVQLVGWDLAHLVARSGWPISQVWQPNDVAIQRYQEGDGQITPHRDYRRDILLVGVFTICGVAPFEVIGDPAINVQRDRFMTTPGSLVLLRGPGLTERQIDDRPVHAVYPPIHGDRISIAYRHNISFE